MSEPVSALLSELNISTVTEPRIRSDLAPTSQSSSTGAAAAPERTGHEAAL